LLGASRSSRGAAMCRFVAMRCYGQGGWAASPAALFPMETLARSLPPLSDPDVRLLLATSRPPIRAFFESLGFYVGVIAIGAASLEQEHVDRATLAAVDVALDPWGAVELCRKLAAQRPSLPVVAVVCCPQALTPW